MSIAYGQKEILMDEQETKVVETSEAPAPVVTVEELSKQLEQIKAAQSGSDRAYQEAAKKAKDLEAENEKLKKEKMSEKEKAEYEMAKSRAELEVKSREVAEATLRLSKMRIFGEKNVSLEFADYIGGSNEEEIKTNLDTFLKRFDDAVQKRVNEKLGNTKPPESGVTPLPANLPDDWRKLESMYQGK
jgi:DNA repair exonuclease SbcCD ATPase subunit